ncbi:hypothetical protein [Scytonema sp. NUACC21]
MWRLVKVAASRQTAQYLHIALYNPELLVVSKSFVDSFAPAQRAGATPTKVNQTM